MGGSYNDDTILTKVDFRFMVSVLTIGNTVKIRSGLGEKRIYRPTCNLVIELFSSENRKYPYPLYKDR